jgi:hypothetical protein
MSECKNCASLTERVTFLEAMLQEIQEYARKVGKERQDFGDLALDTVVSMVDTAFHRDSDSKHYEATEKTRQDNVSVSEPKTDMPVPTYQSAQDPDFCPESASGHSWHTYNRGRLTLCARCSATKETTQDDKPKAKIWTCPWCNVVYDHPWGCQNKECAVNNGELNKESSNASD